jgi:hypothetical protein
MPLLALILEILDSESNILIRKHFIPALPLPKLFRNSYPSCFLSILCGLRKLMKQLQDTVFRGAVALQFSAKPSLVVVCCFHAVWDQILVGRNTPAKLDPTLLLVEHRGGVLLGCLTLLGRDDVAFSTIACVVLTAVGTGQSIRPRLWGVIVIIIIIVAVSVIVFLYPY